MNNLRITKSQIIAVFVTMLMMAAIYGFHTYLIKPMAEDKTKLTSSIGDMGTNTGGKDNLSERLQRVKQEVLDKEEEVAKMEEELDYKPVNYIEFLDTVGEIQDSSGVELLSITEDEVIQMESHWEIPYNIVVAGEYGEILKFVNSLYGLELFHIVTSVKFKEDEGKLTSGKNTVLSMGWAKEILDRINEGYEYGKEVTEGGEEKDIYNEGGLTNGNVLHLDLSLKFVTIEDPQSAR